MPPLVPRKVSDANGNSINWIIKYAETIEAFSEAPQAYNVWSAISVISAVLKKRVWVNRGTFKVYPNQYIVLVGPPGVGKGTAIHPAHDFIRDHKPPLANYISDRATAPRIIEILSKGFPTTIIQNGLPIPGVDSTAVLMCSELQTFLGASDWMLPFLCDVWDNKPFHYDTKNKGTHIVKDMCCSLIGACVPEFIRRIDKNTGEAVNGGFTARTLFIFATDKSKSLVWPTSFDSTPATKQIAADLSYDLEQISKLSGEFTFTNEAKILFERAYKGIQIEEDDSNVVRAFKARQNIHIMKLAMCFSAASNDTLVIDGYCMKVAVALINNVLKTLDITFRGVGESPLAEATAKVQIYLERKGLATRAQILKDCYRAVTPEDLDRILYVLTTISFCESTTIGGRTFFKHLTPIAAPGGAGGNNASSNISTGSVGSGFNPGAIKNP